MTKLQAVSVEDLEQVIGGQSVPPGMAGGNWSGAPAPITGQGGYAAPGMSMRDTMQGGAVSPGGGPVGGINTSPGGGGNWGGGMSGGRTTSEPQALLM